MKTNKMTTELEDVKINVRIKLSALWAAVMFLYVYADIKAFFKPGIIEGLMAGKAGDFQITQGFLLVSAIIMTIPGVMIFLSLSRITSYNVCYTKLLRMMDSTHPSKFIYTHLHAYQAISPVSTISTVA